jgi:hypothetical protein
MTSPCSAFRFKAMTCNGVAASSRGCSMYALQRSTRQERTRQRQGAREDKRWAMEQRDMPNRQGQGVSSNFHVKFPLHVGIFNSFDVTRRVLGFGFWVLGQVFVVASARERPTPKSSNFPSRRDVFVAREKTRD